MTTVAVTFDWLIFAVLAATAAALAAVALALRAFVRVFRP